METAGADGVPAPAGTDAEARLHVAPPAAEPGVAVIADERIPLGSPLAGLIPFARVAARTVPAFIGRHRLSLVLLLLLPVAIELGARAIAPDYGGRIYTNRLTGGQPIGMNQQIHRGPEVPTERTPGVPRWVALGDSVTYGTGVAPDDTWARQLERRLAGPDVADPRERYEVLAAGIPGLRLSEIALAVEDRWPPFQPDGIVLGLSPYMVALAWIRRNEPAELSVPPSVNPQPAPTGASALKLRTKHALQRLCLPGFVTINGERGLYALGVLDHRPDLDQPFGPMLAHGWQQADLSRKNIDDAWTAFEAELRTVRDASRRESVPIRAVVFPSRFTLSMERRDNLKFVPLDRLSVDFSTRATEVCSRLGIPVLDGQAALRTARRTHPSSPMFLIEDYTHLDRTGHAVIAEALAATGWFDRPSRAIDDEGG